MIDFDWMGKKITDFKIVFDENSFHGEDFLAYEFQHYAWKSSGYLLPIIHESEGEDAYEIVIGGEVERGFWQIDTKGHKLLLQGTNLFGYMDLANFFREQILMEGRCRGDIPVEWHKKRTIYQDVFEEKRGNYRITFHNVWGMDAPHFANRPKYTVEYVLAYGVDIACMNEFYGEHFDTVPKMMQERGYAEVKVVKPPQCKPMNCMPIFYRPDRFRLLDASYVDYWTGDVSKGATIAVFESLSEPGKKVGAICNHFNAAWDCPQAEKIVRIMKNQHYLFPAVNAMAEKWPGVSFFIGGDFNCRTNTECFQNMLRNGYESVHDIAEYRNDVCSCHGYPTYSEATGNYITGTIPNDGNYGAGIDHTMILHRNSTRIRMYRVMGDSIVPVISDHAPQMTDFDL